VISNVGSPPVLACLVVLLTAMKLSSPGAWLWGGVYALLAVLIPLLYVVWLVKRGDITDIDVQLRKQRFQPLLVTMTCTGLAWLVLALGVAPTTMTIVAGALWFQVVAIFAITLRWKVSVHTATAAGATTMVWALLGTPLPLMLAVPLIAWSRVRLRRHTLPQTVVGALLGFVIFCAATLLMPSG
jgi:membrane-associated phospholipid phosphatase